LSAGVAAFPFPEAAFFLAFGAPVALTTFAVKVGADFFARLELF